MVQALINTLNTPNVTSTTSSMSDCNAAKTDFQKLFDKQNAIEKEDTSPSQDIQEVTVIAINPQNTEADSENDTESMAFKSEDTEINNDSEIEPTTNKNTETEIQTFIGIIQNIVSQVIPTEENNITSNEKFEYTEYTECETNTKETAEIQNIGNYNDLDINLNRLEISNNQFKAETPAVIQTKTKDSENVETKSIDEIVDEDILQELNIESISTETANEESSSDLMQNQTPQEQGVRAMLQTDADFTEIKSETKPVEVNQKHETNIVAKASPDKIVEQISKHMEKLYNGSKLEMVLNPEALGKVTIQLINTKEGLSAQFTVATQEAKNLIMKGIDGLKDNLLSHGVNVDNVSVKLNDTQESEYNSDWTEQDSSGGENKQQNKKQEQRDKKQFEQTMAFVEEENGKV